VGDDRRIDNFVHYLGLQVSIEVLLSEKHDILASFEKLHRYCGFTTDPELDEIS
jgi:hypothetical protein